MTAELEIRNLVKSFGNAKILNGISLEVLQGELFFLLGPSGCGKSTLLRSVAGLIQPDSGTISLCGKDITNLAPEQRNTPMVFQNYALWPHLDVYENIAFGLKVQKCPSAEIRKRVSEILEIVELPECIHRKVGSLSGGQQQRIALARALVMNAPLLLLDEPLSNLDAKLRDIMRVEIRKICKQRGVTALYVTHDRREALSIGDKIAVLNKGSMLQCGTPWELYRKPENRFTASFLGNADFIPAVCAGKKADGNCTFTAEFGSLQVSGSSIDFPENGRQYTLMIRPEAIRISDSPDDPEGIVTDCTYLGESVEETVRLPSGLILSVNEFAANPRSAGSPVRLHFPPDQLTILRD